MSISCVLSLVSLKDFVFDTALNPKIFVPENELEDYIQIWQALPEDVRLDIDAEIRRLHTLGNTVELWFCKVFETGSVPRYISSKDVTQLITFKTGKPSLKVMKVNGNTVPSLGSHEIIHKYISLTVA